MIVVIVMIVMFVVCTDSMLVAPQPDGRLVVVGMLAGRLDCPAGRDVDQLGVHQLTHYPLGLALRRARNQHAGFGVFRSRHGQQRVEPGQAVAGVVGACRLVRVEHNLGNLGRHAHGRQPTALGACLVGTPEKLLVHARHNLADEIWLAKHLGQTFGAQQVDQTQVVVKAHDAGSMVVDLPGQRSMKHLDLLPRLCSLVCFAGFVVCVVFV
jgi:hypothetical protein